GAGMNLALACDIRYASSVAGFAETFVRIGLIPDWAGHHLLPRLVGTARALELMMTGERLSAEQALQMGLVNQVFPEDEFDAAVRMRALALARGPSEALAAIKHGVYLGASASLEQTLEYEAAAQLRLFLSDDAREGMRAFLEKRPPRFGDSNQEQD
ncbi:MAG: enoyl-CoA hydratase/isomerase family protein, partial [Gammaproteobacteria bacterium]|nr:enoyl-CoA hydratase/isomerase family protein [Gammaproteobacteria bacterium]